MFRALAYSFLILFLCCSGCSGDGNNNSKDGECTLGTAKGCKEGQVCESITGKAKPGCFAPIRLMGKVFDLTNQKGISGATLVALNEDGAARSTVVLSQGDGTYSLTVPVERNEQGQPQGNASIRLRVDGLGYQSFPTAPRTSLPIQLTQAKQEKEKWVVQNATTDIGLLPLPGGAKGLGSIKGQVDTAEIKDESGGGILIVAEVAGKSVSTAISDRSGRFTLFNLPTGDVKLLGYRVGLSIPATQIKVEETSTKEVVLKASADNLATVSGSISFADAPGGSKTSVLLIVESTFNENSKRGEFPAGLRASNVTGSFSIPNVPPGKYVVLAAFENDGLVRDPDQSIGGTSIVRITVNGGKTDTGTSFKITGALKIVSPGADKISIVKTANPVLQWEDDSSEDGYEIKIYNALGELKHENKNIPRVTGSPNVQYTWSGGKLIPGMIYQFRVLSWRKKKGKNKSGKTFISASEDLLGVFLYNP